MEPQPSVQPTTTAQEDLTVAGQRRVNLIWEYTQAIIAVIVVLANILAALVNVFDNKSSEQVPTVLSSSLFLVIGFYFSRTNHQAIGGLGSKANEQQYYKGR